MQAEKIVSVKSIGIHKTYDIEVNNKSHLYFGNGIAISNSHSVSYAKIGYWTAYIKAHFPLQFYCSWLTYAHEKINPKKEIKELVNDAKSSDIAVLPPLLHTRKPKFHIEGESVRFGLTDVKGVGAAFIKELEVKAKNEDLSTMTWNEFLYKLGGKLNKTPTNALILAGSLDYMGGARQRKLYELGKWLQLTDKEQHWIVTNVIKAPLVEALALMNKPKSEGGGVANKNRIEIISNIIKSLENPPYSMDDNPEYIASEEEKLLGVALSISKTDAVSVGHGNCTCKEFADGRGGTVLITSEVTGVRPFKIKKEGTNKNKFMSFLTIQDSSCELEGVVAFPDVWDEYKHLLVQGNVVLVHGERDKNKGSLVVKKVQQL